jgi:hypothetical protein
MQAVVSSSMCTPVVDVHVAPTPLVGLEAA